MIQPHSSRQSLVCTTKPSDTQSWSLTGIPSATAFISTTYCNTNWFHDEALLQASRDNHTKANTPQRGRENQKPKVPQNRLGHITAKLPQKAWEPKSLKMKCPTPLLVQQTYFFFVWESSTPAHWLLAEPLAYFITPGHPSLG